MTPEAHSTGMIHAPAGLERTEFMSPATIHEACACLEQASRLGKTALLLAGGTDLIVDRHLLTIDHAEPVDRVINLRRVEGFRDIRHEGDMLVFGAGVTYWDLRASAKVQAAIPMLQEMAKDVGAIQIQTRGTLAGNIATASPAADGSAALMALDAVVTLESSAGARDVSLEAFFVGYRKTVLAKNELITKISVRVPSDRAVVRWRKVGTRRAQSISKVALASVVEFDGGRISRARFGIASVAAATHALPMVRRFLEGKMLSEISSRELERVVEQEIRPIDDVRSTGKYRLHVSKALIRSSLQPHPSPRESAVTSA